MARPPDSGKLDFAEVFHRVEAQMLAQFSTNALFEHTSSHGTASEQQWLAFFNQYLPHRFRAAPAFIVNSSGRRSRQIDIAIYDNLQASPIFPHPAGVHIPVESVYAVFEVKPTISRPWLRDAGEKAASVRALQSNQRDILAGLLAASSEWTAKQFATNLRSALKVLPHEQRIDIGCALEHASFDRGAKKIDISRPQETLFFFTLRLIARLNALGPTPPLDVMNYAPEANK